MIMYSLLVKTFVFFLFLFSFFEKIQTHPSVILTLKNSDLAAIAPSLTERVLTTCPPERLFIATVCLQAEHQPCYAQSAWTEEKNFQALRLLHDVFSNKNTQWEERIAQKFTMYLLLELQLLHSYHLYACVFVGR